MFKVVEAYKGKHKFLQKPCWPTSKSMQAFLATVPTLYQVNGKTVPPEKSQVLNDKDCGYVRSSEPHTLRLCLNFYQYHPCTIQQAGDKIKREKLKFIYIIGMW